MGGLAARRLALAIILVVLERSEPSASVIAGGTARRPSLVRQWREIRGDTAEPCAGSPGARRSDALGGNDGEGSRADAAALFSQLEGAAARGVSGQVYLGCNLEFRGVDLYHCIHAEEFALISALNHGEAWVSQMAVTAAPCGYCRQLLAEAFCTLHPDGGEEEGGTGEREFELFIRPSHIAFSLQQLLPMAFGPRDLEETSGLFTRRYHPLVLAHDDAPPEEAQDKEDEGVWRQLTIKALECATRSHSPYSNSPAGVALRLKVWDSGSDDRRAEGGGGEGRTEPGQGQWKIVGGSYYENCAFNPSTSPVKAALVAAVCSQLALDSISHAVLVQLEGAAISHAASTSALIASTSPTCAVRVVYARAPV